MFSGIRTSLTSRILVDLYLLLFFLLLLLLCCLFLRLNLCPEYSDPFFLSFCSLVKPLKIPVLPLQMCT